MEPSPDFQRGTILNKNGKVCLTFLGKIVLFLGLKNVTKLEDYHPLITVFDKLEKTDTDCKKYSWQFPRSYQSS